MSRSRANRRLVPVSFPFLSCFRSPSFSFLLHVSFLAILPFPLFLFLVLFLFAFFNHFFLPFAACKGWARTLFADLRRHTHTHSLTVRMPVLIPKIATRKGGRRNNDRAMKHPILFIVAHLPFLFLFLFFSFFLFPFPVSLFFFLSTVFCVLSYFRFLFPFSFLLLFAATSRS